MSIPLSPPALHQSGRVNALLKNHYIMKINFQANRNFRKSNTSTVKDALQDMLDAYKLNDRYKATELVSSWGKLMGTAIGNRTEKVFMKDKKLFVKITSAPLKHKLSISKPQVLDIFRKEFGENAIEDLVLL